MVTIKLRQISKKLRKSVSDIARETGINRNTITALYHNKVDGIRFETISKICDTYFLDLKDLLEYTPDKRKSDLAISENNSGRVYKQEGEIIPFSSWPWMLATNLSVGGKNHPSHTFGKLEVFFRKDRGSAYWDYEALNDLAKYVYATYGDRQASEELYGGFAAPASKLEELYKELPSLNLSNLDNKDFIQYFDSVVSIYQDFWQHCLFLDAFEVGFDQEETARIATKYKLSLEEVRILTTPVERTYADERRYALLQMVEEAQAIFKVKEGRLGVEDIREMAGVREYQSKYDYYNSTYSHVRHIKEKDVLAESQPYLKDRALYSKERKELEQYPLRQVESIEKVLRKHGLSENPLYFFQKITQWREYRKKSANLMGITILHAILDALSEKTGIEHEYLGYLSFEELPLALKRLVDGEVLKKRFQQGVLISIEHGDYSLVMGEEAASLRDELEARVAQDSLGQIRIIGHTGSSGYARGVARVIAHNNTATLEEGEILVAPICTPDMRSLIERASAVVTDEGGSTSYAAVVCRELGKPCIVGTHNATQEIGDGYLIEVRANHATVRIIAQ